MKKITLIIALIMLAMLMSACGGGDGTTTSDSRDTTNSTPPAVSGRVTLSWVAPTTRADNSYLPVTELQGYRIYYGSSPSDLSMLVDLNDDGITEYTLDSLPSGNYYFAVTAYDSDGAESGFSNVINKDV